MGFTNDPADLTAIADRIRAHILPLDELATSLGGVEDGWKTPYTVTIINLTATLRETHDALVKLAEQIEDDADPDDATDQVEAQHEQ